MSKKLNLTALAVLAATLLCAPMFSSAAVASVGDDSSLSASDDASLSAPSAHQGTRHHSRRHHGSRKRH